METVGGLVRYVESLAGHALHSDEGVLWGSPEREVAGVTVCWMGTADAIAYAGEHGDDLLIVHESLYYPYDVSLDPQSSPGWEVWPVNRGRMGGLERHGLTVLRLHGTLDEICVFDDFAQMLELGTAVVAEGLAKVYEIAPCTLDELVARVKRCTGLPALRVARPAHFRPPIRRVGLPWGGLGLFANVAYQQSLIELGCDAFVSGESDNYGLRFAQECGIATVETSHEVSENPGLRHFAGMMAEAFPDLTFRFYENACVWEMK